MTWPGEMAINAATVTPFGTITSIVTGLSKEVSLERGLLQLVIPAFACNSSSSFWPVVTVTAWSCSVTLAMYSTRGVPVGLVPGASADC